MIKGIVKIDNEDYKYKLKVVEYWNTSEPLGFINISYKHDSLFYRDIFLENEFMDAIYDKLDNFTKDKMYEFVLGYIKDDVEDRNRKKKYR